MMKPTRTVLAVVLTLVSTISTLAQGAASQPDIDKDAQKIRTKVVGYGNGHRITVTLKNGNKYHGAVGKIDDVGFEVREADLQQSLTVNYYEVKKVEGDYGGRNMFGQRVSPKARKIGMFAGLGALAALFVVLVKGLKED